MPLKSQRQEKKQKSPISFPQDSRLVRLFHADVVLRAPTRLPRAFWTRASWLMTPSKGGFHTETRNLCCSCSTGANTHTHVSTESYDRISIQHSTFQIVKRPAETQVYYGHGSLLTTAALARKNVGAQKWARAPAPSLLWTLISCECHLRSH